jgi:hypothetical protein
MTRASCYRLPQMRCCRDTDDLVRRRQKKKPPSLTATTSLYVGVAFVGDCRIVSSSFSYWSRLLLLRLPCCSSSSSLRFAAKFWFSLPFSYLIFSSAPIEWNGRAKGRNPYKCTTLKSSPPSGSQAKPIVNSPNSIQIVRS